MFLIYVFIFGLIIGSFLNVVIYRLENGEDMVSDRSHCMDCRHTLAWYDLVPVFSFLALGGKCRYCKKPISIQYPLVEIATALMFVLSLRATPSMLFGTGSVSAAISYLAAGEIASSLPILAMTIANTFYLFFIISSLIVIFVYDLKHYIIPDKIVYSAIALSLIYRFFDVLKFVNLDLIGNWKLEIGNLITLFNPFIAAIVASGFFFAIVSITKGAGMGGGDVKLAFLMGLVLGWPNILLALFLAFATGAIYGIILIILKKKDLKSEVPFGPFLAIGTLVGIFWGEMIVKWYLRYLF